MGEFFTIAKTDFMETFGGAWIFPLFLLCVVWILWKETDQVKKILLGILSLVFLGLYWFPPTGLLFMKVLGEDVYWRLLWLILPAVVIPYAFCIILKKMEGICRYGVFFLFMAVTMLGGKKVLSEEWFEASTNVYKIPQYVVSVGELLPGRVHVLASNRLTPYLRLYDPTLTLEYARNALSYNGMEEVHGPMANLYKAVQESEIDVSLAGPLAKEEGCTFLIFSASRTYAGDWADYGYEEYASTDEFVLFVDRDYVEGQDTRKWED